MLNLKNKVVFKGDRTLWYVVIGLMLASLIVVYSSTGSLAFRVRGGNTSYYLIKQLFLRGYCSWPFHPLRRRTPTRFVSAVPTGNP